MANFISKIQVKLAIILSMFVALSLTACSDDDDNNPVNPLPQKIQQFISEYFPEQEIADFSTENGNIIVNLANSASLTFNQKLVWIDITGNGNVLPQQLLYDQLPTKLYEYLQTYNSLEEVYAISRDSDQYIVTLQNGTISYDAASDTLGDLTL